MIKDHVYKYYIAQNRSCAESIFLAANEEYQLEASAQTLKAAGAFSGGVCCGSLCGAAAGGAIAIALATGAPDAPAHDNVEMREKIKAFIEEFTQATGSELCREVKPKYVQEGQRCLATVELAADILEKYLTRHAPGGMSRLD